MVSWFSAPAQQATSLRAGVEHRPAARKALVKLLLIDANCTPNTGDPATATHAVEL